MAKANASVESLPPLSSRKMHMNQEVKSNSENGKILQMIKANLRFKIRKIKNLQRKKTASHMNTSKLEVVVMASPVQK